MPPTPAQTEKGYANLWNRAQVRTNYESSAETIARKIIARKADYQEIQRRTGVPWYFIGPVHSRESSLNFKTHLHNGDPLTGRTYHVPAGRPKTGNPPFGFVESAVDALTMAPHALNKITNWSLERILYEMEKYNGWGYLGKTNSPYLWAWTSEYSRGKYVADGVWDPNHVDTQAGTVAILKALEKLDPEVAMALKNRQPNPPKDAVDTAVKDKTGKQKGTIATGVGTTIAGGGAKTVPDKTTSAFISPTLMVIGAVVVVVGIILLVKKQKEVRDFIAERWG